ncbi:hypothetical protein H2201_005721 [Coniosporium apollinis]|uniref:Uncharacterized protein n=1 Tax=Coniosporium apollinis TaxID=61459 RepID=A0ABQ9NQM9_9PEZI|nr:hypothetical protein H2201_005721 [Coniosporium apollinis]
MASQQLHPPAKDPMDQLQDMLNLVLMATAHTFKDPVRREPGSQAQVNTKKHLTGALHCFHESLDSLGSELSRAQAVMRRDLALCQATRVRREQAEAAERSRHEVKSSPTITKRTPSPKQEALPSNAPDTGRTETKGRDIIMIDEPTVAGEKEDTSTEPQMNKSDMTTQPSAQGTEAAVAVPNASNEESTLPDPAPSDATTQQQTAQPEAPTAPEITDPITDDHDLFGGSPTAVGGNNMDLEHMNFDDFTNGDSTFPPTTLAEDITAGANSNANDEYDFSSLLPGLESYANNDPGSSNDFSMIDLPGSTDNLQAHNQQHQAGNESFGQDSTFDDIFSWDGLGGTGDLGDDTYLDDLLNG